MERKGNGIARVAEGRQLAGIVDCLGLGFEKINGMLWVLLFPVAMSLFLWLGPQFSTEPAMAALMGAYTSTLTPGALGGEAGSAALSQGVGGAQQLSDMLRMLGKDFNLFTLLTFGLGIAGRGAVPSALVPEGEWLWRLPPVQSPFTALGLGLVVLLIGLLLGTWYLGFIGQRVRGEQTDLARLAGQVWRYWLSALGYLGLITLLAVGIMIPTALALGLAAAFAPSVAEIAFMLAIAAWQVAGLWLMVFTFFLIDAIVVGELGSLLALKSGMSVVQLNFWSSAGFIVLYLVITFGMMAVWSALGGEPWARAVSIVGNGYIASGLAAASMIFYRTRVLAMQRPTRTN